MNTWRRSYTVGFLILIAVALPPGPARAQDPSTLDQAHQAFYNARYQAAAELTQGPCLTGANGLAACELYTTALLFQVRRHIGDGKDKKRARDGCAECPPLIAAFKTGLARGQGLARARLQQAPLDDDALFLLGKLDLNYVWLQLGTLGHKTGWNEYWEARRSLDAVLARQPGHVRARLARGWIDYIVATKMTWGTRWLLGGGDKTRGLAAIRNAAATEAEFFTEAEARFALWDVQVRERDIPGAVTSAAALIKDFPENHELARFLDAHDPQRVSAGNAADRP